jgi:bifunctional DNase/RNase
MTSSKSSSNVPGHERTGKNRKRLVLKPETPGSAYQNELRDHAEPGPEWIKVAPYGVSVGADEARPVVLLKVESGEEMIPVPVSPLEAGVTLSQSASQPMPNSPHAVTREILQKMGVSIERCEFCEIRGPAQYADLHLRGPGGPQVFRTRADEAISLCLYVSAPLYATREFIAKSRVLNTELEKLQKAVKSNPAMYTRSHKYFM